MRSRDSMFPRFQAYYQRQICSYYSLGRMLAPFSPYEKEVLIRHLNSSGRSLSAMAIPEYADHAVLAFFGASGICCGMGHGANFGLSGETLLSQLVPLRTKLYYLHSYMLSVRLTSFDGSRSATRPLEWGAYQHRGRAPQATALVRSCPVLRWGSLPQARRTS